MPPTDLGTQHSFDYPQLGACFLHYHERFKTIWKRKFECWEHWWFSGKTAYLWNHKVHKWPQNDQREHHDITNVTGTDCEHSSVHRFPPVPKRAELTPGIHCNLFNSENKCMGDQSSGCIQLLTDILFNKCPVHFFGHWAFHSLSYEISKACQRVTSDQGELQLGQTGGQFSLICSRVMLT